MILCGRGGGVFFCIENNINEKSRSKYNVGRKRQL